MGKGHLWRQGRCSNRDVAGGEQIRIETSRGANGIGRGTGLNGQFHSIGARGKHRSKTLDWNDRVW